ncbi:MAG: riboflavin biosynthesis protein RibF [Candidatus Firestonebacteria bacterium]|nr:riboflavin biosynthesis protein RibF [Candidatus Firestonebacteria bacterium]
MKSYRGFPKNLRTDRVLTLGVFDGPHLGHREILRQTVSRARRLGLPAAVVTFDDHPHGTLAPEKRPPQLALPAQRRVHFEAWGIQELFTVHFTQRLADTEPEVFVSDILCRRLRVRHMVVGEDFVFGRRGRGTLALLKSQGAVYGFGVTVVKARRLQGRIISSTNIRALVAAGEVAPARDQLGWPYTLHGRVVHGEGRGAQLGMPTANLETVHEIVPAPGVYIVRAHLQGRAWPALCHIGPKPTFHARGFVSLEVHIPGWQGHLYGRRLEVSFYQRLRGIRKFAGVAPLKRAIEGDWRQVRKFWPREKMPGTVFSQ